MKTWQLYLVYVLFTSINAHTEECGKVVGDGTPFRAQGVPGKRGMPGVVDYGKVKEMIEENLYEDIFLPELVKLRSETEAACDKKIIKLSEEFQTKLEESRRVSALDSLKSQMSEMTTRYEELFTNLNKSLVEYKERLLRLDPCKVMDAGKCFWIIVHDKLDIGFAEAERLCSVEDQGMVGNIYSEEHYNSVAAYARTLISGSKSSMNFWTGMRYDPETKSFSSSDGQSEPFVKWLPGYPSTKSTTNTHVKMRIQSLARHRYQGMYNWPPTLKSHGVLCEA